MQPRRSANAVLMFCVRLRSFLPETSPSNCFSREEIPALMIGNVGLIGCRKTESSPHGLHVLLSGLLIEVVLHESSCDRLLLMLMVPEVNRRLEIVLFSYHAEQSTSVELLSVLPTSCLNSRIV